MSHPFVFACITPHGSEIIEKLSPQHPELMKKTRESMEQLGAYMSEAKPDTILVITPHGVRIEGQFCIADCERMEGVLQDNGAEVGMERSVDRELAKLIADRAVQAGIPTGKANFGSASGSNSCLPLDWGVIVPLAFMPEVPIVVMNPTRELSFEDQIRFGVALAEAVRISGKRVGLIASCDWSHAHDENGPYGFHPAAADLDAQVVEWIHSNQLEKMCELSPEFIENAKPDGIWQTLILAGALPKESRRVEFLSYEVPTYFGLICAAYH